MIEIDESAFQCLGDLIYDSDHEWVSNIVEQFYAQMMGLA